MTTRRIPYSQRSKPSPKETTTLMVRPKQPQPQPRARASSELVVGLRVSEGAHSGKDATAGNVCLWCRRRPGEVRANVMGITLLICKECAAAGYGLARLFGAMFEKGAKR